MLFAIYICSAVFVLKTIAVWQFGCVSREVSKRKLALANRMITAVIILYVRYFWCRVHKTGNRSGVMTDVNDGIKWFVDQSIRGQAFQMWLEYAN